MLSGKRAPHKFIQPTNQKDPNSRQTNDRSHDQLFLSNESAYDPMTHRQTDLPLYIHRWRNKAKEPCESDITSGGDIGYPY